MTVKNVLKLVCEFVGEKELLTKLSSESAVTYTSKEQEKLDTMLRCLNLVNQEIASDYLPFIREESVDENNSTLLFSTLSEDVVAIYQVKDRFGFPLRFKNCPNSIKIEGKAKKVIYSYLPEELEMTDSIDKMNGLSERVYAYGVASEFLMFYGFGSDAEIWEDRFKTSLFMLSQKHGEHRLPHRRWF